MSSSQPSVPAPTPVAHHSSRPQGLPASLSSEAPLAALAGFGLPAPVRLEVVTSGLMNRNWYVTCPGRDGEQGWALKQVLDVDAVQARFVHQACHDLAAAGLPVPLPVLAPDGDSLVRTPEGIWSLTPWVPGQMLPATTWSVLQVAAAGELLGRVHQHLAVHLPPPAGHLQVKSTELDEARRRIGRYQNAAGAQPVTGEFDDLVATVLQERQELLIRFADQQPPTRGMSPAGWCHGDFHDLNILWDKDIGVGHERRGHHERLDGTPVVAAVLDWDRLSVRPLASEVVRTATLCFATEQGLDLARVSAFVTAYRKVTGMAREPLIDATHWLWWERICEVWQLKRHYDQQDTSCDHLFRSASTLVTWWSENRARAAAALSGG